jgi:hypothetical protein
VGCCAAIDCSLYSGTFASFALTSKKNQARWGYTPMNLKIVAGASLLLAGCADNDPFTTFYDPVIELT